MRRRGEQVILCVEVSVQVRVKDVGGLAMGSYDESGQVIWDGRMVGRGINGINGGHDTGTLALDYSTQEKTQ